MKVTVEYLFSNSDLIGSKAIVFGTAHLYPHIPKEKVPSHISMLINGRWVHESTLENGVSVMSLEKWLIKNKIVARIPCKQSTREYNELKDIFRSIKGKKYDYPGVSYLGICLAGNKFIGTTIPDENKWEKPNRYFCCEAVEKLSGVPSTSMKAPVDLMMEWSDGKIKTA